MNLSQKRSRAAPKPGGRPARSSPLSFEAKPLVLLAIAGHDPSSGAGITADLATFAAHGFFGTSAITQLTVQSSQGVSAVKPIKIKVLAQVLAHLDADLPAQGIKIGLLGGTGLINSLNSHLKALRETVTGKPNIPIVLDPVLSSSSGRAFLSENSLHALRRKLLRRVDWITPNWPELARLAQLPVQTFPQAEAAMHCLARRHPHLTIVATGGDRRRPTDLLRLPDGEIHRFPGRHVVSTSTHGTGCAFSSALLCRLVQGYGPVDAVQAAKDFVTEAIRRAPGLGRGRGPLNLLWPLQPPPTK